MGNRRQNLNVFLDSSVLFSASYSPFGGSAKLFTLPNITLHCSPVVLHEVEKNIRNKVGDIYIDRFLMLIKHIKIINQKPKDSEIKLAKKVIAEKDSVILSEFKRSTCRVLITLDKQDFLQEAVFQFVKPKKILTPKLFFELIP